MQVNTQTKSSAEVAIHLVHSKQQLTVPILRSMKEAGSIGRHVRRSHSGWLWNNTPHQHMSTAHYSHTARGCEITHRFNIWAQPITATQWVAVKQHTASTYEHSPLQPHSGRLWNNTPHQHMSTAHYSHTVGGCEITHRINIWAQPITATQWVAVK